MDVEKYYDAVGNELHIGDAVRAVPTTPEDFWVSRLEYGIITKLYGFVSGSCYIDMRHFSGTVRDSKYGVHAADCKYVIKIDDRCNIVAPSSSLLDCLDHI